MVNNDIYCVYCLSDKPLNQRSLNCATFCSNCKSAYHKVCINKCTLNDDGSVVECCGNVDSSILNNSSVFTSNLTSNYIDPTDKSKNTHNTEVSNNQILNILSSKLDSLQVQLANNSKQLDSFYIRISKNSGDIAQLNKKIDNLKSIQSQSSSTCTTLLSDVLSEQEDRSRRSKNILVYNLPEMKNDTPADPEQKKLFFNSLTEFNNKSIMELLRTIDDSLEKPVFFKRLGKYNNQKIRPLLLSFFDPNSIKLIFKRLDALRKVPEFKNIVIRHDLTFNQRETLNSLRPKCDELNSNNTDSSFHFVISHKNSNPTIIKQSKNLKPHPTSQVN